MILIKSLHFSGSDCLQNKSLIRFGRLLLVCKVFLYFVIPVKLPALFLRYGQELEYFHCKQEKPIIVILSTKKFYCKNMKAGHRTKGKAEKTGAGRTEAGEVLGPSRN